MEPSIVFCDEPTGALDERNSDLVVGELQSIAGEVGVGVLMLRMILWCRPSVTVCCDWKMEDW